MATLSENEEKTPTLWIYAADVVDGADDGNVGDISV